MNKILRMGTLNTQTVAEIRAEMARQRRPQRDLAAALGLTVAQVSRRMTGVKPLTVDELEDISRWLDTSPDVMVSRALGAAS